MTFGRMRSAHLNAMALGWGNNVIFAVGRGYGSLVSLSDSSWWAFIDSRSILEFRLNTRTCWDYF